MPTQVQAGVYSAVTHYLKAVDALGSDEAKAVVAKMRDHPMSKFGATATLRADGRVISDVALYQVKSPAESKYPWDDLKLVRRVPGDQAFLTLDEGGCPLVKK